MRYGLNSDLDFSDSGRKENIRRAGEVAKLMVEAGIVVICAFISPFEKDRLQVRNLFTEGEFFEVFVDTPLEECMRRDFKGLYKKAVSGEIANFTGISSGYERPVNPEFHIKFNSEKDSDLNQFMARIVKMFAAKIFQLSEL